MATSQVTATVKTGIQSTYGSGADKIVLNLAQDYYYEDVKFTVTVDGKQVGGIFSVSATTNSGTTDQLTLLGDWGAGKHDIQVSFLNDRFNAATDQDSNLKIAGISMNGTSVLSTPTYLFSNVSRSFSADVPSTLTAVGNAASAIVADAPKLVTGTIAADILRGTIANEVITGGRGNDTLTGGGGRDIFVVNRGDGTDTITDFKATGTDADIVRVGGQMISTFDDMKLHMRQSGANTVLELSANNYVILQNVKMTDLTAANFQFLNPVAILAGTSQSAGTGSDKLVLKMTQDWYQGDNAKFTVAVDGVQVGGVFSASAVRMTGQEDTLTLNGNWGAGNHNVTVTFLNDAFNAQTLEDRSLFINSATINGVAIAGAARAQYGNGSTSFTASIVAPVVPRPVVVDTTHDIFGYNKGVGAKVIEGFSATGDGSDVLRISDFGLLNKVAQAGTISSFAALKANFTQVGADTVIKLSATDSVTLKGVKATDLSASNFSFMSKLDGSMEAAANNGWIVFNNTWGSTDLTYGKDYKMTATYDIDNVTSGTTFTWDYGAPRHDYTKVLGYPSVMYGFDTFGNAGYVSDPAKALPVKISDLDSFTTKFDVNWGGEKAGYDVSYDIWLTNKPNGIWSDITNEVMIWLHRGEMGIWGDYVGTYTDGTYTAKIYHTGTYTALVPDQDYTAGQIDVADVLKKLQALGIVSSTEYVNQIDFGAEPWKGSGSLTIKDLSFSIQSHDASGIVTKDFAGGGATEVTKIGTAAGDFLFADGAKIVSLFGGAGNDTFQFTKGQAGTVQDFHAFTTASAEHDVLKFVGYGSGAALTHDGGDAWTIHYAGGEDHLTLHNVTSLSSSDYIFA